MATLKSFFAHPAVMQLYKRATKIKFQRTQKLVFKHQPVKRVFKY